MLLNNLLSIMKVKTIATGVVLLAAVAGAVHMCDSELIPGMSRDVSVALGLSREVPGSYIGNNLQGRDWKDPDMLQERIEREIFSKLKGISSAQVQELLIEPRHRLLLAQWMLAQQVKLAENDIKDYIDKLKKEETKLAREIKEIEQQAPSGIGLSERVLVQLKKQKERLRELRQETKEAVTLCQAMELDKAEELMHALGNNLDWMEQILFSGECVRPGMAIAILSKLLKKYPDMVYSAMVRDIATATAIEFARYGWGHARALERAEFYISNWEKGQLNEVFDTLPFWERRIVCGCKGDNDFGSVESLQWSLENVHLPADKYPGCCWRCGYKLFNVYGESIHGPGYNEPFNDFYGKNRAKFTYEVGGVCGSLSHFGAFAALANGVPALTAGEPGHCAFIVKVGDKWTPAYSLSWERGLHWQPFRSVHVFSSLHAMEALQSPKQADQTRLSQTYRVLAEMYRDKDDAKVLACLEYAQDAQPLNYMAWREHVEALERISPHDSAAWIRLNERVCELLVTAQPELAAALLRQEVYPSLRKAVTKSTDLVNVASAFWKKVDKMGVDRWRIEELLTEQRALIGAKETVNDAFYRFFETSFRAVAANMEYSPVLLTWGNTQAVAMPEAQRPKMMQLMLSCISGSVEGDAIEKMLPPIVLSAEKMQDITTFQALSKMLPAKYTNPEKPLPAHEPFPGKLVSRGGLIAPSSTSNWDRVCAHWGVLEPIGGQFHTAREKDAWVMVQLPRQATITGVVAMATGDHPARLAGMKVQVSATGKDGDWQDVAVMQQKNRREYRVDCSIARPTARFVRILRPGGPEFFHLSGIYVYGEQAS